MKLFTKFICTELKHVSVGVSVSLEPVTAGSLENDQFKKVVPQGSISILVSDPMHDFEVGKEFYLEFVPVEEYLAEKVRKEEREKAALEQRTADKAEKRAR